jgi:putative transposase
MCLVKVKYDANMSTQPAPGVASPDHFIVFGEKHLAHIVAEYQKFFNTHRPHQGVGNVPLSGPSQGDEWADVNPAEVQCEQRLGGLLKHYYRKAA